MPDRPDGSKEHQQIQVGKNEKDWDVVFVIGDKGGFQNQIN